MTFGLVDGEGKMSDTVLWSLETAAAHAESLRLDDAIVLLETALCGLTLQNGQMKALGGLKKVGGLNVASRKARPPMLICSMCQDRMVSLCEIGRAHV